MKVLLPILLALSFVLAGCYSIKHATEIEEYEVEYEGIPEFSDERTARNWVVNTINYEEDIENRWQLPHETLERGSGDCEDHALLIAWIFVTKLGVEPSLVVAVGHVWIVVDDVLYDTVSRFTWIKAADGPGDKYTYKEAMDKAMDNSKAFE